MAAPMRSDATAAERDYSNLAPDLITDIHRRLTFTDRLAAATVFGAAGHALKPEAPWLFLLPAAATAGDTPADTNRLYSVADKRVAAARPPGVTMRDCYVIGSSGGWVVTADKKARLHMVNPVNGEHHALPAITTCHFFFVTNPNWPLFHVNIIQDQLISAGGETSTSTSTATARRLPLCTVVSDQMRGWVYRKVILSASPRPGNYAAMLLLDVDRHRGTPAFATSSDPTWRVAASSAARHGGDGVEDAIHHNGKFYSVSYSGIVEEWSQRSASAQFTSRVVSPTPAKDAVNDDVEEDRGIGIGRPSEWHIKKEKYRRNYIVAAPDGKMMVVTKYFKAVEVGQYRKKERRVCFKVQVLLESGGRWKNKASIGQLALFVGGCNSVSVMTKEHPEVRAGCVYFAADELAKGPLTRESDPEEYFGYSQHDDKRKVVGVYSLKDGARAEELAGLGEHANWPPPAWFMPYLPPKSSAGEVDFTKLPTDLVAGIHTHLTFLDRLTPAVLFAAAGHSLKPESPWLAIPGNGGSVPATAAAPTRLYSISDRLVGEARAGEAAMRDCFFLGSGDGWLITADKTSRLRMVNPITGIHHPLPAITTCPFFYTTSWTGRGSHVNLTPEPFMRARYGGEPPAPEEAEQTMIGRSLYTVAAVQMRQFVYRKVVLSAGARPGDYAAMLLLGRDLAAPMFASSDHPAWRVAASRDGVEDAIHHEGKFYSVTYTGVVEEWDRRGGEFTSRTVATMPPEKLNGDRKYMAAAPEGKLMVVTKFFKDVTYQETHQYYGGYNKDKRVFFEILVLDGGGRWREAADVGESAALFLGTNASMFVSRRECPELVAGGIYFTDDDVARRLPFGRSDEERYSYYEKDERKMVAGVYNSLERHRARKLPVVIKRRMEATQKSPPVEDEHHEVEDEHWDMEEDGGDVEEYGDEVEDDEHEEEEDEEQDDVAEEHEEEEEVELELENNGTCPPPVWFKPGTTISVSLGRMRVANVVTGEQWKLPAITTISFLNAD
uniref:KIB1-4 beta-propeller domain-containing protein n=1 Tax=Leersia perrieri TaxID=77586 RepID=A0A0D9W269_9ORYZ